MKALKLEKQTMYFKIERRASEYNKYIKWFVTVYNKDMKEISVGGYKTQREAREYIAAKDDLFPIGNKLINHIYIEV